jgi:hypothetical protein
MVAERRRSGGMQHEAIALSAGRSHDIVIQAERL